nr:hypothetical protein [Tsukamurella pulmonis]
MKFDTVPIWIDGQRLSLHCEPAAAQGISRGRLVRHLEAESGPRDGPIAGRVELDHGPSRQRRGVVHGPAVVLLALEGEAQELVEGLRCLNIPRTRRSG